MELKYTMDGHSSFMSLNIQEWSTTDWDLIVFVSEALTLYVLRKYAIKLIRNWFSSDE